MLAINNTAKNIFYSNSIKLSEKLSRDASWYNLDYLKVSFSLFFSKTKEIRICIFFQHL